MRPRKRQHRLPRLQRQHERAVSYTHLINLNYSEGDTPIALKSDFILSFCELIMGGKNGLEAVEKTLIDRAVISVYRNYLADPKPENMPILGDLYDEIKKQPEKEAQRIAAALEPVSYTHLDVYKRQRYLLSDSHLDSF